MGKYAATRSFQRDRHQFDLGNNSFHGVVDYLFEVPKSEDQFMVQSFLYSADPTGFYRGALGTRDFRNYWNDYFAATGLTWSDVKYPTMMNGFGSLTYANSTRSAVAYVSKNIGRLYR